MKPTLKRIDTKLIHAGEPRPRIGGAVSMPIFQSANFEIGGENDYNDLKYIRLNNTPNHCRFVRETGGARKRRSGARDSQRHGGHLDGAADWHNGHRPRFARP